VNRRYTHEDEEADLFSFAAVGNTTETSRKPET